MIRIDTDNAGGTLLNPLHIVSVSPNENSVEISCTNGAIVTVGLEATEEPSDVVIEYENKIGDWFKNVFGAKFRRGY